MAFASIMDKRIAPPKIRLMGSSMSNSSAKTEACAAAMRNTVPSSSRTALYSMRVVSVSE